MKTKHLILTVLLAALIVAPLAVAAPEDGPRGKRGPGGEGRMAMRPQGPWDGNLAQMLLGRFGEELNLTDAQKESIKAIAEESKTAIQEGYKTVQNAMQALNDAADNGDEAAITAAGKAAGDALTKQAINRAEVSKKIKAVLTEEQLVKLNEMKAEMKERMEQRREQMRDGNGPHRGEGRSGGRGPRSDTPDDDAN